MVEIKQLLDVNMVILSASCPVAHNTICHMLLSMATARDFEIDLVDVCQAFLNASLEEEIYMRPAPRVTEILGIPNDSWLKLQRKFVWLATSTAQLVNYVYQMDVTRAEIRESKHR
jgi:hypothetical protein